jgi:hypothetical protein
MKKLFSIIGTLITGGLAIMSSNVPQATDAAFFMN